jgi:hypothetical protein
VSPELPIYRTVITAAEATIATIAIVIFFTTEYTAAFPVAAVAIVAAPAAADAPVKMDARTAIDSTAELRLKSWTMPMHDHC